jgi:hypothetical protein
MPNQLFPSQQPNERIILVVREHWFRLFLKMLFIALFAAMPFLLQIIFGSLGSFDPIPETERGEAISSLLLQVYYIVLVIATFIVWILYYLNLHIVSEERIVDIDQVGLLNHMVSELNVETIEDVTGHTIGLFGNLLDYGTVYIQTAGATERFEFDNVPHPGHIAKIILEVYENHQNRERPKP